MTDAPTCHLTATASQDVCGESLIEVGDLLLCPTCDQAAATQIRTRAF